MVFKNNKSKSTNNNRLDFRDTTSQERNILGAHNTQQASQDDDFDNDLNDRQPINDNIELPSL